MKPDLEEVQETPLSCLVSALARLMTHYALQPNADNAQAVVRVLRALSQHPEVHEQPMLQNTYGRMLPHWQSLEMSRRQDALPSSMIYGSMAGGQVH